MINKKELEQKYPNAVWYKDGFTVQKAKQDGHLGEVSTNIVEKPWGFEIWLFFTDKYALKYLMVNQGSRLSLQSHQQKEESWLIEQGHPQLTFNGKTIIANPWQKFHIPTGTVHRISAIDDDVVILEVSSPELWDVVRISDDFGRES